MKQQLPREMWERGGVSLCDGIFGIIGFSLNVYSDKIRNILKPFVNISI